jgi:hypothetical protein
MTPPPACPHRKKRPRGAKWWPEMTSPACPRQKKRPRGATWLPEMTSPACPRRKKRPRGATWWPEMTSPPPARKRRRHGTPARGRAAARPLCSGVRFARTNTTCTRRGRSGAQSAANSILTWPTSRRTGEVFTQLFWG